MSQGDTPMPEPVPDQPLPDQPLPGQPMPDQAGTPWRRLDRRMLLVHPVQELIRFFPVILGAVFVGRSSSAGPLELLAVAAPVLLGLLRYVTTSYRVTATQVDLRRGLIGTKVVTARLDRVRAVELSASPIHRVLGLAKVEIGTGSAGRGSDDGLALDALAVGAARELRTALLHRIPATGPTPGTPGSPAVPGTTASDSGQAAASIAPPEELLRLDPAWVRYAPLTSSGSVIAAAALGLLGQVIGQAGIEIQGDAIDQWVLEAGLALALLLLVAAFLVTGAVFSLLGYLVTNWDFRLTRDADGGSFHVVRGLLTRTETSLERARLRGVEVGRPLGLRLAGATRLTAVVTGLSEGEGSRNSALLAPPAPARVVQRVAGDVLDVDLSPRGPVCAPLRPHGPAARRRRLFRAVGGAGLIPIAAAALAVAGLVPWPLPVALLVVLPLAWLLGADRYRQLGHALVDGHLVGSSGTLNGRRVVLQGSGVIGWNVQQSWFQRRAGLVTLVATTAAGRQRYAVPDLPEAEAVALADALTPGLLTPFLAHP